jgi:hypothetical protein
MAGLPRRRPRGERIALALAALAVVGICLFAELRYRPTGGRRDALWTVGIVAYALLLNAAIGPARDYRERDLRPGDRPLSPDGPFQRSQATRTSEAKAADAESPGAATIERIH